MRIEIDNDSGFCFGVVTAIRKAEEQLAAGAPLCCLGDIVHNSDEVQRLAAKGLRVITHAHLSSLPAGAKVLLRAHGEPPSTYATAKANGIEIIDATCPVVLRLQQRIKHTYTADPRKPQIVIYGKKGHAEVNGLVGQTSGEAIVVESASEVLSLLDFSRPVVLYSQTTMSVEGFSHIADEIGRRMAPGVAFESYDTICRQVANRAEKIRRFARAHSVVLFVAGKKSSNGKVLFARCLAENPRTHLVSNPSEISPEWFGGAVSVGICGATSTPRWLMEQVAEACAKVAPRTL